MRTRPRSFLITVVSVVATSGCSQTHHAGDVHSSERDAGNARPQVPDAGNPPPRVSDGGNAPVRATDAGTDFTRIPLAVASAQCSSGRPSIAIGTPPNVLVATGCALYSVNTETHEVVLREAQGDVIDEDGRTIAVIAGKLGLSLDGGETFTWTDWALGRCQGAPRVAAGDGLAVVDCVAGGGRWRGEGTAFEPLTLGGSGILPFSAARGSHVIIEDSKGWNESTDRGDSWHTVSVSGLPAGVDPTEIVVADSKLFTLVQLGAGTVGSHMELFAAPFGSRAFTRVTAFPSVSGQIKLSYNQGTLVAMTGSALYFSTDSGESFTEQKLESIPLHPMSWGVTAKYGSGNLYILTDETLYVGTLAEH